MSKEGGKQGTEGAGEWVCGEQAPVMEKAGKRDWGSWRQHLPRSNRAHFSLLEVVFSMTLAVCSRLQPVQYRSYSRSYQHPWEKSVLFSRHGDGPGGPGVV